MGTIAFEYVANDQNLADAPDIKRERLSALETWGKVAVKEAQDALPAAKQSGWLR
jgi:hypothetical protein